MMGFGLIFAVMIVIAFIYLMNDRGLGNLLTSSSTEKSGGSALDIAKKRYARGEINEEEYERLRRDLES